MKKAIIISISFLSFCLLSSISKAAETVDITFKFKAINTIEGFDLKSKLVVYCDNKKIGESEQKLQSKLNTITVIMPKGNHYIKAVLIALTNAGIWEERTIANDYSLDFIYDNTKNWQTNKTINLTFDITKEVVIIDEKDNNSVTNTPIISSNKQTKDYTLELKKLNDYLKTFDNGYYGYLEIKDGYLFDRFSSGKYSKSEIKYLGTAVESESGKKVSVKCKEDKECVFSTYTDSYHSSITFSQLNEFNTNELISLLNNLISACNKNEVKPEKDLIKISNTTENKSKKDAHRIKLNEAMDRFYNSKSNDVTK